MLDHELFIFKDAAKLANTREEKLLDDLISKDILLLYKPSSLLHLFCISTNISKTAPIKPFEGFLDDNRSIYQEIKNFDYIALESNIYENILNTKTIKLVLFNRIASYNHSKELCITSAKDVAFKAKSEKNSTTLSFLTTSATFCLFKNKKTSPSLIVKKKIVTFPPTNPCELNLTINELWVRGSDLNRLYPSILQHQINKEKEEKLRIEKLEYEARAMKDDITQLENLDVTEEWMNDNLIMLNRACIRLLIEKKISTIDENEQITNLIRKFISDNYRDINKKEISKTVLDACTAVVTTEQLMKNMHPPSPSEKSRYHTAITPAVVNMNELTRKISERIDRNNPPSIQDIKDEADNEKALPKRISQQLARFMLPKP